jgi:hypothetical protein
MTTKEEVIVLSWSKLKLMMVMMGEYGKVGDPIAFKWETIGLRRKNLSLDQRVSYGWYFDAVDKQKLVHAIIKYGLEL